MKDFYFCDGSRKTVQCKNCLRYLGNTTVEGDVLLIKPLFYSDLSCIYFDGRDSKAVNSNIIDTRL